MHLLYVVKNATKTLLQGIIDLMVFPSEKDKGKRYRLSIFPLATTCLLNCNKSVTSFMSDPNFLICFSELLSFSRLVTVVYNIPCLLLKPKRESVVIVTLRTHWQGWMTHKQVGNFEWNMNWKKSVTIRLASHTTFWHNIARLRFMILIKR